MEENKISTKMEIIKKVKKPKKKKYIPSYQRPTESVSKKKNYKRIETTIKRKEPEIIPIAQNPKVEEKEPETKLKKENNSKNKKKKKNKISDWNLPENNPQEEEELKTTYPRIRIQVNGEEEGEINNNLEKFKIPEKLKIIEVEVEESSKSSSEESKKEEEEEEEIEENSLKNSSIEYESQESHREIEYGERYADIDDNKRSSIQLNLDEIFNNSELLKLNKSITTGLSSKTTTKNNKKTVKKVNKLFRTQKKQENNLEIINKKKDNRVRRVSKRKGTNYQNRKLLGFSSNFSTEFKKKFKLTYKGMLAMLDRKLAELKRSKWRRFINNLNNSKPVNYSLSIVIFISIFGDDLRMLVLAKKYDSYVDGIMGVIFLVFFFELLGNIWSKGCAYLITFMFVLDLFATFSMALDMAFISDGYLARYQK